MGNAISAIKIADDYIFGFRQNHYNLIEAYREVPELANHLHLPVQSGSDRILSLMKRGYTALEYKSKIRKLRKVRPDIRLSTDIIVGFPTETEEEFQETLSVFEQVNFSVAFVYTYSARQGTPAMRFKDDIPEEVKQDRLQRLMDLHTRQATLQRVAMLGSTVEVLFTKRNKNDQLKGKTSCWKKVISDGPDSLIGTLQKVKIHSFNHQTLIGTVVK